MESEKQINKIETFIREKSTLLGRSGAVIGLSGGLDSAVAAALTVRALGKEKVHLLNLPERDSNPLHRRHAKQFSDHLGMPLHSQDISAMLRSARTYRILPLNFIPGRFLRGQLIDFARERLLGHNDGRILTDRFSAKNVWLVKGNAYGMAKHRLRMALIYQFAELRNLMVIGAANRTEWLTGTFCLWGIDHCADIMPLVHIYRSQLEGIATHLEIPDNIRLKASDPDLYPTRINKEEFLGGYGAADMILLNLEKGVRLEELRNHFGDEKVDRLHELYSASRFMREIPCVLNNGI